jgi:iron complex transport system ATP-binding protein
MILSVEGVTFRYNGRKILQDVEFQVPRHEILAILGPNGVGKTTLLRCINTLLRPEAGTVIVDKQDLLSMRRQEIARLIAYVPQRGETGPVTAFDAILLGRRPHVRWDVTQEDLLKVQAIIDQLHLGSLALRPINSMSGGELQKVMIARALVQEPCLLLLDEPTSSLDLKNQAEILAFLRMIVREHSLTAVLTMHDINQAIRFADRFLFLKEGEIFAAGSREIITPEMIEAVYGIPVTIAEVNGMPCVVPGTGRVQTSEHVLSS